MWALLATAAAADLTLDADLHLSMRVGGSAMASARVWRGLTLGGALDVQHDPYVLDVGGLDFEHRRNLRVGLLPAVGWLGRPGPRDRVDVFSVLQVGPELLWTSLSATTGRGAHLSDDKTLLTVASTWESGLRVHAEGGVGVIASLRLPVHPGPAGGSVPAIERVGIGLGVSWRPLASAGS